MVVGVLLVSGMTAGALLVRDKEPPPKPREAIAAPATPDAQAALAVDLRATGRGEIAVDLPGGFGFKIPTKDLGIDPDDFEIGGVGLYPGATAQDMQVRVLKSRAADGSRALITMAFSAPDSPRDVADWYVEAFADEDIDVTRSGDQLAGTTPDGNRFTMALMPAGKATRGVVSLRAANRFEN